MKVFLYILFTFSNLLGHAQNKQLSTTRSEESVISKKLDEDELNVDADPKEKEMLLLSLKQQSEALNYHVGILRCVNKLMRLYSDQGRYREVVDLGNDIKKSITDKKDPQGIISTIYRLNALNLGYLGLDDASQKDFRTAIKYAETIESRDAKLYKLSLCYQNMNVYFAKKYLENRKYGDSTVYYLNKSQELAKQIRDNNGVVSNSLKYSQIAYNDMRLGMYYLQDTDTPGNLKQAEKYLLEAAKIYNNGQYDIRPDDRVMMLNQLSWLYLEKKDYKTSIDYAKQALAMEKEYRDPENRVESYEFLASSYLETGEKEQSKFYMDRYTLLKDSLTLADKKNADISMKKMVSEVDNEHKMLTQRQWILTGLIFCGLAIITWLLWRRKNKGLRKKYEEMISRLQNETLGSQSYENNAEPIPAIKNGISNNTEKDLLVRLENFEAQEAFLDKDITLTTVATMFNTNTKYLSETIKKYRSQNFSNYINSLRVNYIVHKLYNEPRYRDYKISYLAEQCGFATYQVFILAFRKEHGVTPSYFIQNLKHDKVITLEQ